MSGSESRTQVIGIDTGGTFTDTVVVMADGRFAVGKAFSTPPDFELGVLDSLRVAAASMGDDLDRLLRSTDVIAHGTTVGLNGLLTRTGANVGLLVTAGFESTLPLAKANKLYGLPADEVTNSLRWDKPPLLVPRRRIRGVRERIDVRGDVITALDEEHAREAIALLAGEGVEAIGIALLWSTVNPDHERRLRQLVTETLPGIPVTLSSELAPRIGEYERTSSVAVNAYVAPMVGGYLGRLGARLQSEGFAGQLLVMTMSGGVLPLPAAVNAPIHTLQSGPAAGLAGARRLGRALGHANIITTDVGGTSFDVGLVIDGELPFAARPMIERQALAVPVVDITSIGTGGGSIAWFDDVLGTLRVGPRSAGSRPGPACYGRGGTMPTVTDAAAVLGYIDQLGAQLLLDVEAAAAALKTHVADPLGLDVQSAASGVLDVAVAQMADLIRRTTVRRGHDPADFVLYGFGGAAPQYIGRYAPELGVRSVLIPHLAAEFSAAGAATSELRSRAGREIAPCPIGESLTWLSPTLDELTAQAVGELSGNVDFLTSKGVTIDVKRRFGLRFYRQLHAIDIAVPDRVLDADDLDRAAAEFRRRYEEIAGRGTSSAGVPVELVSIVVDATMTVPVTDAPPRPPSAQAPAPTRRRTAWFGSTPIECPVFEWNDLGDGDEIDGPAFVESEQTTAVVFPGQTGRGDAFGNLIIDVGPADTNGSM